MSFDLFFYARNDRSFSFEAVQLWACSLGNFTTGKNQLMYENPDTGVYFSFDFSKVDPSNEPPCPLPSGYMATGLSFNINFNRPAFFGLEAFPIVERLCSQFGLYVFNPQGKEEIGAADSAVLMKTWEVTNTWAIQTLAHHPNCAPQLHLALAKSTYYWNYVTAKKALEKRSQGPFVPQLRVMQRANSLELGTAAVFTLGIPMIVPECDWIIIAQKKSWFRKGFDLKPLEAATFYRLLGSLLEPFDFDGPRVQVIRPKSVREAANLLAACDRDFGMSELKRVAAGSFVDVDLPIATSRQ